MCSVFAQFVALEGYLWAHAIVLSRALPFGEELSLIPLLDLANHEAGAPNQVLKYISVIVYEYI